MKKHFRFLTGLLALAFLVSASGGGAQNAAGRATSALRPAVAAVPAGPGRTVAAVADFGRMPLQFIANKGQLDQAVAYYVQGTEKTLYFSPGGATIVLGESQKGQAAPPAGERGGAFGREARTDAGAAGRWAVKLDFLGSNPQSRPAGRKKTDAVVSYFKGKPADWKTGVPTYSEIVYSDLWPGIDLVYYGTNSRLKYEFIVHPGADPSAIRLAYRGASSVEIGADGRLEVATPRGRFFDDTPAAHQDIAGRRAAVSMAYKLSAAAGAESVGPGEKSYAYGFEVGAYDRTQTLVLDPAVLVYCGYVGGNGADIGNGIAVDSAGNAYITGSTTSTQTTFPVTAGPDLTHNAGFDAFVAKINATGTGLVYCGFIGGAGADYGNGIAVDNAGCAYVTGTTDSDDDTFPVAVGPDLEFGATGTGGYPDAFVAKVNASGTGLDYCGYIGGRDEDRGYAIAVDGSGCAYVAGFTTNDETLFPALVGPDVTYNGTTDTFVAKVNAAGTGLVYRGYIGGLQSDYAYGIAVDTSGNAYVAGLTYSDPTTFPVSVGPDLTFNGTCDAYVAKINAAGTGLDYCGYIGGSGTDIPYGIVVDGSGSAYVVGLTNSTEATFPVAVGPDLSSNGNYDAFVAKVTASGDQLAYCGYIGGDLTDFGYGIAVDGKGSAYVTGEVASSESTFPVIAGPDVTYNANRDAFVAKVKPGGFGLEYCGYVGGTNYDYGTAIAVDASGNAYLTGKASLSTDPAFPVTGGPDLTFNGFEDAFVAKVYFFDENIAKHAVGDFDGDGTAEAALDFGALGVWVWNGGVWGQILPADPENLMAANVDGDGDDEIIADLGTNGLWLWNGGAWTQLSSVNAESLAASDMDWDGSDEIIGDFGASGLWLWDGGGWTQLAGIDAQYAMALNADGSGGQELAADFGPAGLWLWSGNTWTQLSGVNPNHIRPANIDGLGAEDILGDFGPVGAWLWSVGSWVQISGSRPDYLIGANVDGVGGDEIVGDFGTKGLWLWASGAWTQLSGVNADYLISADADGDGAAEILADFGAIGLWLWNGGTWTQLSGANPEFAIAGDFDGDSRAEFMVDFGRLGLWLWNEGVWTQTSGANPD